jgi:hypothetical protein
MNECKQFITKDQSLNKSKANRGWIGRWHQLMSYPTNFLALLDLICPLSLNEK